MESGLVVIGLNYRTAPLPVRERFWLSEAHLCQTLVELARYEGIDESAVLVTSDHTDYVLWASDISVAANSIQAFLARKHDLRLSDWQHFYRLFHDAALSHLLRAVCGLDCGQGSELQMAGCLQSAWSQAQLVGTAGHHLDSLFSTALTASKRAAAKADNDGSADRIAATISETVHEVVGNVAGRRVLLIGVGPVGRVAATRLAREGARVQVTNRDLPLAQETAQAVCGTASAFGGRFEAIAQSEVVISATSCPHFIIGREMLESVRQRNSEHRLCLFDAAVPRDIDPAVREVPGVLLFDLDELQQAADNRNPAGPDAILRRQQIVTEEAEKLRKTLSLEQAVPAATAVRNRLDEISMQELRTLTREVGPLAEEQMALLEQLGTRIAQRIASAAGNEMKSVDVGQHSLASTLKRLLRIEEPRTIRPQSH